MTVRFVAYIDESGDPGIQKVKPLHPNGSSEWFVISCLLVREENDHKVVGWVKEIQARFRNVQSPHLHFADLLPVKQRIACEVLAGKPCAMFSIMSNKANIQRYHNRRLNDGNKSWLYWWLCRLLLERVTDFCEQHVPPAERGQAKLRIVFSRRGGLRYTDFENYLVKLYWQSQFGMLVLDQGDLCWSVIDFEEVRAYSHKDRAGLQLADVVAGAFFQSVECDRPALCDPACAKILKPRVPRNNRHRYIDYSVKTMPALWQMNLRDEQKEIFEFYGYGRERW